MLGYCSPAFLVPRTDFLEDNIPRVSGLQGDGFGMTVKSKQPKSLPIAVHCRLMLLGESSVTADDGVELRR